MTTKQPNKENATGTEQHQPEESQQTPVVEEPQPETPQPEPKPQPEPETQQPKPEEVTTKAEGEKQEQVKDNAQIKPVLSTPQDFDKPTQKTVANTSKKGDGFFYTIMCFLLVGIFGLGGYYWFSNQEAPQVVVVVDVSLLASAQLKERVEQLESPEAASEAAMLFLEEVRDITGELANEGYIVLNANTLLDYPESIDITPLVAQRLGINIGLGE